MSEVTSFEAAAAVTASKKAMPPKLKTKMKAYFWISNVLSGRVTQEIRRCC
jgi:hypothetical protein